MEKQEWIPFVERIIRFASHGYHWYARVDIPQKKASVATKIDSKIMEKFPETTLSKDQRYRRKKAGYANYVYLRYNRWGLLLKSRGKSSPRDDENWSHFAKTPYEFPVGEYLELKIGPGGKSKYTCYLTRRSYRAIKTLLRELFEDQRWEQLERQWHALSLLPAYSGMISQVNQLYDTVKSWRVPRRFSPRRLRLQKLY